jgi:hypothetical protein
MATTLSSIMALSLYLQAAFHDVRMGRVRI